MGATALHTALHTTLDHLSQNLPLLHPQVFHSNNDCRDGYRRACLNYRYEGGNDQDE
jgi:hypothetical protein